MWFNYITIIGGQLCNGKKYSENGKTRNDSVKGELHALTRGYVDEVLLFRILAYVSNFSFISQIRSTN